MKIWKIQQVERYYAFKLCIYLGAFVTYCDQILVTIKIVLLHRNFLDTYEKKQAILLCYNYKKLCNIESKAIATYLYFSSMVIFWDSCPFSLIFNIYISAVVNSHYSYHFKTVFSCDFRNCSQLLHHGKYFSSNKPR